MARLGARWRDAGGKVGVGPRAPHEEAEAALMTLIPGGSWRVVLGDHVATVPDRVGMRHLARLLSAPERRIPALVLVVDSATEPAEGGPDPVMDRKAMRALRERIDELRAHSPLSAEAQAEMAELTRELARATGLGGRIRSFADAPERARTAVQKAVKRAIDEIAAADPAIGQHLTRRVETGATCCYRPERGAG
jgi:hypothetical protein